MSSAFCNIQRIANIVIYLVIVSLSPSLTVNSRTLISKFSTRCLMLHKFGPAFLALLLVVFSVRNESVVMYVDVVLPSITSNFVFFFKFWASSLRFQ